jgi:hypothetical protein
MSTKPPPGYKELRIDRKTVVHIREDQDEEEFLKKYHSRKIDSNLGYVEHFESHLPRKWRRALT